jgi:hypothetical protein
VLREISGTKRAEVTGEWRKLHIKELRVRLGSSYQGSLVGGIVASVGRRYIHSFGAED